MAARTNTSYAAKAGREAPYATGKPIFIKHKDIPSVYEKVMTNEDMYKCLLRSVQGREIKGVQRIGGLWRLYIENQDTRMKLITNGVNMRNANVAVYDTNPFLTNGKENSLRLLIKDIPLSAHESLIIDELERMKYKVMGSVIYQRLRVDGQLTDCLTGDRVVYIEQPPTPLPRNMNFGLFKAKVFHFGQVPATTRSTVVCSKCLSEGHHRSQCSSPVICRRCKQPGHIQQECSFETPPTSPTRGHANGNVTPPPAGAVPPAQGTEQLIASGRQAAAGPVRESSAHHDNQTRAQAKITQYLKGDRNVPQQPPANNASIPTPPPADGVTHAAENTEKFDSSSHVIADASSEDSLSDDDGREEMPVDSEISVESPELPKHHVNEKTVKLKRKQKSTQKLPKKK